MNYQTFIRKCLTMALCVIASALSAQVKSPDGQLTATIQQHDNQTFIVVKDAKGQQQVSARIGFTIKDEDFANGLSLQSISKPKTQTVSYTNIHGKQREVSHKYRQATAAFTGSKGTPMSVEMRVFNDGLAFRYVLSEARTYEFADELTAFELPANDHRWLQKFVTSYEGDFPYQASAGQQGAWNYPALFENNGTFVLLTEANLSRMYSATHLDNSANANTYKVSYPFPFEGNGQGDAQPSWTGSWTSPWRLAIVGSLADVVESTLVDDVSDPCTMTDTSWILPGRAAWVYWAYNHGTRDFQICKQYVDLAVKMGWEYVLFDWEWDSMTNGGKLEDAVAYALSKGIKPWMWYNSGGTHTGVRATPLDRMLTHENRVEEFTWLKSIGIAGVKVDFFESDKQKMMAYYLDILDDAIPFKMMVNFHGCTAPRGWSHTYPHLMSQEAVFGAEQYNNTPFMTANGSRINCLLPYTRNVVGPMDYTPVAFTNSQNPHETSFAHELALSVAFESGVQHWADRPDGFYQLPEEAQRHMRQVPVVWDETRFLSGYPGESFVVARRSGKTWYVAGLNGTREASTQEVSLQFLPKGKYTMTIFADGEQSDKFAISRREVSRSTKLSLPCLQQGGFLLTIEAIEH